MQTRVEMPTLPQVSFDSGGVVLLHGDAERVQAAAVSLADSALRLVAVTWDEPAQPWPSKLQAVAGRLARVEGWAGKFRAFAHTPQGQQDIAPFSPKEDGTFDLVLDFGNLPMPSVTPLGYYAPTDESALAHALADLPKRVGTFHKPQYFTLDEARCVHQRQGVAGCRACLDACPAGAIRSGTNSVAIEPSLCQGCGTCALVCPTAAVRYAAPSLNTVLAVVQAAVAEQEAHPLCLCAPAHRAALANAAPAWWALELPQPAAYGLDLWLSLLSLGIPRLRILPGADLNLPTRQALAQQLAQARAMLTGLGRAACGLEIMYDVSQADWPRSASCAVVDNTLHGDTPHARVFAALDRLVTTDSPPHCPLPTGAAYGEVVLESERCTLCFACVRLCPQRALQESEDALWFTEGRCVQCNVCVNACPTQALRLAPRILYTPLVRQHSRCLRRGEGFACVECGQVFADRAMVAHSLSLMADFPQFQGAGRRLLEMCPDCRQRASLGLVTSQ